MVDVLLGLQWGDEGKGKIVDFLAKEYQIIARFQGGPNAGHTLYLGDKKIVLHTIPSGVFHAGMINLIGNGVVIDPVSFLDECNDIKSHGINLKACLKISERAHLILPSHKALDRASESAKGKDKIGSTLKGIGPTYMDKTGRNGLRIGDILKPDFKQRYQNLKQKHQQILKNMQAEDDIDQFEPAFFEAVEALKEYEIIAAEFWLNDQLQKGQKVLAEGAQGTMLDIDFGTYPFVTSSNTITAGLCTGLGIAPKWVNKVYGVSKAYCTRVGSGPFPSELLDSIGEKLREIGKEFGATTGRPRRCGWIDLVALKYACMINGVTDLVLTKSDILDEMDSVGACTSYQIDGQEIKDFPYDIIETNVTPNYTYFPKWDKPLSTCEQAQDIPQGFRDLIALIEQQTGVPVTYVSNGAGRSQLIHLV
ncbi:MAG: adenylosuccinate synthase [Chitinophagaceae bacterium]|jgi:adenylosuccinate synthase